MRKRLTLWGEVDIVEEGVRLLQDNVPPEGYFLAFSGGKDSVALLELVKMAGVPYDAHFHLTSVDPPEVVRFVKEKYPEVTIHRPVKTMWQLIKERQMFPLRFARFCCQELKEIYGGGRIVLTGVRREESYRRRQRRVIEKGQSKTLVHPLIDWSTDEVWAFIRERRLPYCSLYDEGFTRIGCVMCPLQTKEGVWRDMVRWPRIAKSYQLAADRLVEDYLRRGKDTPFKTGEEYFRWWIHLLTTPHECDGVQPTLFE